MEIIFENDALKVSKTGKDYDFIAVVENKTTEEIKVCFEDKEKGLENFIVRRKDWTGILADETGWSMLEEFESGRFFAVCAEIKEAKVGPRVGDTVRIKHSMSACGQYIPSGTAFKIIRKTDCCDLSYQVSDKTGDVTLWLREDQFQIVETTVSQKIETAVAHGGVTVVAEVENSDNSIDVSVQVDGKSIITFNISADEDTAYLRKWIGHKSGIKEEIKFSEAYDE